MYSVFFNRTCHYGSILNDTTVARSYLFNPTGWGVGYFGSVGSDHEYSCDLYDSILAHILDTTTATTIGEAITKAKIEFQTPFLTWPIDHIMRYVSLASQYYGDPQMVVYNRTPKILHVSHPDWLVWGGLQRFDVFVTSDGIPVGDATVCVRHENDIYEVLSTSNTTPDYGIAHFQNVRIRPMPDTARRYISVTVSKPGYFTSSTVIRLAHFVIPDDANAGVSEFSLEPNYPNPFNPSTNLSFSIPKPCHVSLAIFNVLGQEVIKLVDQDMPQGTHISRWDGTDQSGNPAASGIYFARLVADDFRAERKMMVLK